MFKAIKYLFIFLYHFFFIDQTTGQQSNTKFFANVGYCIWSVLFPIVVLKGLQTNMELWMVFGAVIIGNRTLNVMMQSKYGAPQNPNQTWSAGVMTNTQPTSSPPAMTTSSSVTTSTDTGTDSSVNVITTTSTTPVASAGQPASTGPNVPKTDDLVD